MSDSRRLTGPDVAFPYRSLRLKIPGDNQKSEGKQKRTSKDEGHRPIFFEVGLLSMSQGSAYVEHGRTKVLASVFGPREIAKASDFSVKGLLSCHLKMAPFADKEQRLNPAGEEAHQQMAATIEDALKSAICMHLYPKSKIDVMVTVLEDNGSVLAAALNAVGLAVANSGINMFDLLQGATCLVKNDSELVMDPTREEEEDSSDSDSLTGTITIAYMASLEQVSALNVRGRLSASQLSTSIEKLTKVCHQLLPRAREALLQQYRTSQQASH